MNPLQSLLIAALFAVPTVPVYASPVAPQMVSASPVELAPEGVAPAVASSARGSWAAWTRRGASGAHEVVVSKLDPAGQLAAPRVVSAGDPGVEASAVNRVRVAVGAGGEVYVLYLRREPWSLTPAGRGVLRLARAIDGRTFAAPVDVMTTEGADVSGNGGALAVTPDGTLVVAWLDERDAVARAKLPPKQRPKNVGYLDEDDPVVRVRVARSTDGGAHFSPSVAVGVVTLKSPPNTGAAPDKSLVSVGDKASETSPLALVAGRDGVLSLAWRAKRDELKGSYDAVRDVWTATSTDGGASWQALAKIHNDRFKAGDCPAIGHGLARDQAGRVHAAWYSGASARPGIYYAVAPAPGAAFSAPQALLDSAGWIPYANTAVAVDARNRVWIAFEDQRESAPPQVVLLRLAADGSPVQRQTWPGTAPALASDAHGVTLAWQTPALRIDVVRVANDPRP